MNPSKRHARTNNSLIGPKIIRGINELLERYNRYSGYLSFPYEWGERAFRGWLVFDIFHLLLEWPLTNIVFGEQFDVLFVDGNVKPKIYLETKKPGRGLMEFDSFQKRVRFYGTLRYAVITDGYLWARLEIAGDKSSNPIRLNIDDIEIKTQWTDFLCHSMRKVSSTV